MLWLKNNVTRQKLRKSRLWVARNEYNRAYDAYSQAKSDFANSSWVWYWYYKAMKSAEKDYKKAKKNYYWMR